MRLTLTITFLLILSGCEKTIHEARTPVRLGCASAERPFIVGVEQR
jgi:hypothetical protein